MKFRNVKNKIEHGSNFVKEDDEYMDETNLENKTYRRNYRPSNYAIESDENEGKSQQSLTPILRSEATLRALVPCEQQILINMGEHKPIGA